MLIIVGIALVIRFQVLGNLRDADPALRAPLLDDLAYLEMARGFAAGDGAAWFLAPLYPWLVAQAARFGDVGLGVACGVNAVLGALAAGGAALAARSLHSAAAGWIAGGVCAVFGAFVFHDVIPGQEPALTLLHLLALLAAIRLVRGGGLASAGALGVLAGVAMLGRGTSLALVAMALPALLGRTNRERLLIGVATLGGLAAVLLPVAIANSRAAGALTPMPWSAGPNLYLANGPDARRTGTFMASELDGGPLEIAKKATAQAQQQAGRELTPAEVSAHWRQRTLDSLNVPGSTSEEPGLLGHLVYKFGLFLDSDDRGSSHSATVERQFSSWLCAVPIGSWWWIVLGLPGAVFLARRRREAHCVTLVVAGTWLLLTVFFPLPRYRLPVAALCVVALSGALVELWRVRRDVAARELILPGVLAALLGAGALYPRPPADHAQMRVNLALLELNRGETRPARRLLAEALRESPDHGPACEALAELLWREGRPREAVTYLTKAAQDPRTRWSAQVMAVGVLVAAGDAEQAWVVATGLLGERSDDAQLFAFAAVAAHASGRGGEARGLLARAEALDPSAPAIGWAWERLGGR